MRFEWCNFSYIHYYLMRHIPIDMMPVYHFKPVEWNTLLGICSVWNSVQELFSRAITTMQCTLNDFWPIFSHWNQKYSENFWKWSVLKSYRPSSPRNFGLNTGSIFNQSKQNSRFFLCNWIYVIFSKFRSWIPKKQTMKYKVFDQLQ